MARVATVDDATAYVRDVLDGQIVACEHVRLACERHVRDLEEGHRRNLFFDAKAARRVLRFFSLLPHVKGAAAGVDPRTGRRRCIELVPWQAFLIASLYGWKRYTVEAGERWRAELDDPRTWPRRYRTGFVKVGRKNTKTTLGAGLCAYSLGFDGEYGPEVFSVATKRDQARIPFDIARHMLKECPHAEVRRRFKVGQYVIRAPGNQGSFAPLARNADTHDGTSPSFALVDEVHAHPNRDAYDVIETGTGARSQPLVLLITTGGDDESGLVAELADYGLEVLRGEQDDDAFFSLVYEQDLEDYTRLEDTDSGEAERVIDFDRLFDNERLWQKSNPNLHVSVSVEQLRTEVKRARNMPASRATVLQKRFNVEVASEQQWVEPQAWRALATAPALEALSDRDAFIGLDLAQRRDLNALSILIPRLEGNARRYALYSHFWIPEESFALWPKTYRAQLKIWRDLGHLEVTPGKTRDDDRIVEYMLELCALLRVKEVVYDPWDSRQLVARLLKKRVPCVQLSQSVKNLSDAMKTTETWITDRELEHDHNRVMRWCVGNTVTSVDKNENKFPNKKDKHRKIDGVMSTLNAVARCTTYEIAGDSVYDQRGLFQL